MPPRQPKPGESLAELNPDLAAEWHPTKNGELTANDIAYNAGLKVWWQRACTPGETPHEWLAAVRFRVGRGHGCLVCRGFHVQVGVNDLATVNPDLAAEWHPTKNGDLLPSEITSGSGLKVWWQKHCNTDEPAHEWPAIIGSRMKDRGCAVCKGFHVQKGVNDLATVNPDLAAEWHPTKNGELTPQTVTAGKRRKVWWHKKCDPSQPTHEWEASIASRNRGIGCAVCKGFHVQKGVNDLATVNPDVASEWHPTKNGELTPQQVPLNFSKKVWWQKQCDPEQPPHEWQSTPNARTKRGCPICSGQLVQIGVNDLATVNPDLAAEWHPTKNGELTPQLFPVGTHKKVWWQKQCDPEQPPHEWEASIDNRNKGRGCAVCKGFHVQKGVNDLATVNPDVASEWHPTKNGELRPEDVTPFFSKHKIWWLGNCGHEWKSAVAHRSAGRGCPGCAKGGFDPTQKGWLYLLQHPDWDMTQIGITNFPEDRLADHRRLGWELVDLRGPDEGDQIQTLERLGLQALKRQGARLGTPKSTHKFDGFTEAWPTPSLHLSSLAQLLKWIDED